MNRRDFISGILFFGLSIAICIHAVRINIGSFASPAQGSLPFLSGACLGIFSVWLLLRSFGPRGKHRSDDDLKKVALRRICAALLALVGYALILSFLGFTATTFLFFVFFFRTMAAMTWWKVLLSSALVSIVSYLFFVAWLQCQLPSGVLGY